MKVTTYIELNNEETRALDDILEQNQRELLTEQAECGLLPVEDDQLSFITRLRRRLGFQKDNLGEDV